MWTAFDCLGPMPFPKDRDKVAEAVKKLVLTNIEIGTINGEVVEVAINVVVW